LLSNESGNGGGVFLEGDSEAWFSDSRIEANQTQGSGGGIHCAGYLRMSQCRVADNGAGKGGGFWCRMDGVLDVRRCLFVRNEAPVGGGGAVQQGGSVTLFRNTFVENSAFTAGGGLYLLGGLTTLDSNVLVSSVGGGGLYCWLGAEVVLVRNDVWDNVGGNYAGACTGPPDPDPGENFSLDPLFCDPASEDYRLQAGSPAILAGGDTVGAFGCCGAYSSGARE
jgi:hypothetical protein